MKQIKNILFYSNCTQITESLESKLDNLAHLCKLKIGENVILPASIYSVYDLIIMHIVKSNFTNATTIVKELHRQRQNNCVILTESLRKSQKDTLLELNPFLVFDLGKRNAEVVFNLKSVIQHYSINNEQKNISPSKNLEKKVVLAAEGHRILGVLSKRELELFNYLLDNKDFKEIRYKMGIKQSTIATIKYRLFTKLKVTSLVDLTRFAYEHQIIKQEVS